jgi:hypothetical protein
MSRFSGKLSGESVSLMLVGCDIQDCESFFTFWHGQAHGSVADRACHTQIVTACLIQKFLDDLDQLPKSTGDFWKELCEQNSARTEDDFDAVPSDYIESHMPAEILCILDKLLVWVRSGCVDAKKANHPELFTHGSQGARYPPTKATQAFPDAFHIVYKQTLKCTLTTDLHRQTKHDRAGVVASLHRLAELTDDGRADASSLLYTFCRIQYHGIEPSVSQGGRFSDFVRAMAQHVDDGKEIEDFVY